ncbi:hypothetical protein IJG27_00530 [Candidatus Saccharibacteria bacterium]|nr:hypothetical protein [Candidatus Saccharibacteria bacterium]
MPKKKLLKKRDEKKKEKFILRYSNRLSYDDLMDLESKWGGTIFGPIPAGHRREFFEHKKNVWIWYESWRDTAGVPQELIIRYEVRPAGVFKRVCGQKYEKLTGSELDNFRTAAKNYLQIIKTKLYY